MDAPLVKCPKCGGPAAMLRYRPCPACGERVLIGRMRASGQTPGGGPAAGPAGLMMQPMDIQYWIKQDDGTYTWTSWMPAGSPQTMQIEQSLICTKCGKGLSYLRR